MRPNPLTDALTFLANTRFLRPALLLLLGSAVAAVMCGRNDATHRSLGRLGICLLRIIGGALW